MATMCLDHDGPAPQRGDRLRSPKTLYIVVNCRAVRRRDPAARPRYQLLLVKDAEISERFRGLLNRVADRRGGPMSIDFTWYPRKKKAITFEQLMRGGR